MKSAASIFFRLGLAVSAAVLFAGSACGQTARFEIAAHRGGYKLFPENTCAAFRACEGLADRIEFDVRTSADGDLVVIHDDTVNRTTTGFGAVTNVADLTLAQLKALDAGSAFSSRFAGERIPTLAELFALADRRGAGQISFNIETKVDPTKPAETASPEAITDAILAEARRAGRLHQACGHAAPTSAPPLCARRRITGWRMTCPSCPRYWRG